MEFSLVKMVVRTARWLATESSCLWIKILLLARRRWPSEKGKLFFVYEGWQHFLVPMKRPTSRWSLWCGTYFVERANHSKWIALRVLRNGIEDRHRSRTEVEPLLRSTLSMLPDLSESSIRCRLKQSQQRLIPLLFSSYHLKNCSATDILNTTFFSQ